LKIITSDAGTNPYLLTQQQETELLKKQSQKKSALKVPRRPAWTESTTPSQLELAEKEAFLEWRRGLAHLQESDDLLLTPFERNLEVWRQLWRVIERSDLVVQIVDGRNPLLFRTEDLEKYVLEVDKEKRNLLLVNKADLMTEKQRKMWADWFTEQGIRFAFYSARLAKEAQEKSLQDEEDEDEDEEQTSEEDEGDEQTGELAEEVDDLSINKDTPGNATESEKSDPDNVSSTTAPPKSQETPPSTDVDPRIQILTVHELQSLFLREAPTPKGPPLSSSYPNIRPRPPPPRKTRSRSSRLPQRRQILHHKLPPRRKTRLRLLNSRKNKTLPNDPSPSPRAVRHPSKFRPSSEFRYRRHSM
jgi:large subunit GTPase 1